MLITKRSAFVWAAASSLALVLAACSSSSTGSGGSGSSGSGGPATTSVSASASVSGALVQVIDAVPSPAVLGLDKGYKQEATKLGIKIQVAQSAGDPTKDLANVQDAISKGAKGLLMIPLSVDAIKPALAKAVAAHVCVGIAYSNITPANEITPGIKTYFGYDDTQGGTNLVDAMAAKMNDKGGIVYIGGTASDPGSQTREAAVKAEIAKKYPGIKFLGSQPGNYDPATARSVMQDFVQQYGNQITGVITAADSMSQTVADYIATTNLAGKVLVGGFGGQQSFVDEIKAGKAFATVPLPVVDDGARAMDEIAKCIEGNKTTIFDSSTTQASMQSLKSAGYVVTAANVAAYTPQY